MAENEITADSAGESIEVTVLESINEGGAVGPTTRASGDLQGDSFDQLLIGGNADAAELANSADSEGDGYVIYVAEAGSAATVEVTGFVVPVQLEMFLEDIEIDGDAIAELSSAVSDAGVYSTFTSEGTAITVTTSDQPGSELSAEAVLADDVVQDGAGFSGLTLVDVLDKAGDTEARIVFSYGEGNVAAGDFGGDRLDAGASMDALQMTVPGAEFLVYGQNAGAGHGEFESLFLSPDGFGLG